MGTDILCDIEGIEGIRVLKPSKEILIDDVGLIEAQSVEVVLPHVDVILWFFELVESVNDVGKHLYFLLLGQLGTEVIGLEGFLEEGQHD